jgi:type IV pilus assembly protein PilC
MLTLHSRIQTKDIALMTRQLAVMLQAGVPVMQALEILRRGEPKLKMVTLVSSIQKQVAAGTSLSQALANFPRLFGPLYVSLVAAGELGGVLDTTLDRLSVYLDKSLVLRARVRSALMYPIAVLVVALMVVLVLLGWVIPSFKTVFASLGAELPMVTQWLLILSDALWRQGPAWLVFFTLLGLGLRWGFRTQPGWRKVSDRAFLRIPLLGPFFCMVATARWARTLATLLAAGVPLVDALVPVGRASGNALFEEATHDVRRAVMRGVSVNAALLEARVFPAMLVQLVAIGEASGTLDGMLAKAAEYHERAVDEQVAGLSTLLEPLIIVVLGGIIGGMVLAMYLPLFQLGQVL